jgi:predicted permease
MRYFRVAAHRLRSLFRAGRVEADMRGELDIHLDQLTREYIAEGMSESDARARARCEFGSIEVWKEQCRDMRRVSFARDAIQDIAYACRLFWKSPGFTTTAVVSLALGIGANTAIFTLVNAVLLRMLPVHEPAELVEVSRLGGRTLSYPAFEEIRARNDVFSGVLLTSAGRFGASLHVGAANAGDVHYSPVSGDYFTVLGLSPVLGRMITEGDLAAANAAVIGYQLWQRAFAGDANVLGTSIRLGSSHYTIIGVAPARFTGVLTGQRIDVWVPITTFDRGMLRNRDAYTFRLLARRKPGVTREQAQANMDGIARQLSADWKYERPMQIEVADGSGGLRLLRRQFSRPLWVLMIVVGLLLLIATVNVANLLLARAGARRREIAVRLSIGASRWRLIRQLLTESLVLGGAGAALGLLLAPAAAASLVRFLSSAAGNVDMSVAIDLRVLGFTLATSVVVVALFGLAPAMAATQLDLAAMLKGSPTATGDRARRARPGTLLVVGQVAISCVVLATAILFTRSLLALTHLDAGFQRENILLLGIGLSPGSPRSDVDRVRLYDRVVDRLAQVPGVRSVAYSSEWLFSGSTWTEPVTTPSFTPVPGQDREAVLLVVSPRFFETTGTTVLRGRAFEPHDDERAPRVAIMNETAARSYFGQTDAVDRTFELGERPQGQTIRIVGVVHDGKYRSLKEPAPRMIYLPALQVPAPIEGANLAIRTAAGPEQMADLLWQEARKETADLRRHRVTTQSQLVNGTIAQDRMLAELSGLFGLTAIALACLGLYGLTTYDVSKRRSEIGLRLALGARPVDVVRLVAGRSMVLVVTGVAIGLVGAAALSRLLESLLFGVRGSDVLTLVSTAVMLLLVGLAASFWPARRAARLNPLTTLRTE